MNFPWDVCVKRLWYGFWVADIRVQGNWYRASGGRNWVHAVVNGLFA
jgi:hypothetical protein